MGDFKNLYDNIEAEEFNIQTMIKEFEVVYDKKTNDFRKEFESNGCEGNADEQIWYLISR